MRGGRAGGLWQEGLRGCYKGRRFADVDETLEAVVQATSD